jgi:hypothetical protein
MPHEREHDRKRVEQLRALAAKLEQMPRSPTRDRLIREAHHRTVAVETGVPAMSGLGKNDEHDPAMLFQHVGLVGIPRFASQR